MNRNSPLEQRDMPTVLPGQVSPGQPAMRSPLTQEPHKALESLRYNLPFVPIMPLHSQVVTKAWSAGDRSSKFIDFPSGALAVNFGVFGVTDPYVTFGIVASLSGNVPDMSVVTVAELEASRCFSLPMGEWLFCENIQGIAVAPTALPMAVSARFYIQL